jgi:hypothetical protein
MIDPSKNFYQARLKHMWANKHINETHAHWQRFLETDFCKVVVEDDANRGQTLRIVSVANVAAELVLNLGDAIHNMRCALDYVIAETLGWKDTRITFPMDKTREELIASFRTNPETVGQRVMKKGRNAPVEEAVPGIGDFIVNEICPYDTPDGFLWALGKLDARDKHRLLVPVVVPQTIPGINAVDANENRMINCVGTVSAHGVVNFMRFGAGGVKIEGHGKPTAEILINEVGIFENKRLFPSLAKFSQITLETINRFDEFLISVGWVRPA